MCVVILALWGVSTAWCITFDKSGYRIGVGCGECQVSYLAGDWEGFMRKRAEQDGVLLGVKVQADFEFARITNWDFYTRLGLRMPRSLLYGGVDLPPCRLTNVPLWLPFLIVALPTAFLFYRDRKQIPPGHCSTCGYNLTGAEHERCPECGEAISTREGGKR